MGLEVELLLVPLDRGDIRDLLALKTDDAAYQQVSRYRKAFKSLFPALRALLEEVAAAT